MLPLFFTPQEAQSDNLGLPLSGRLPDSTNRVRRFSCRFPLQGIAQIISRMGRWMCSSHWSKGSESKSDLTKLNQISQISGTPLLVESIPMAISVVVISEPSISTISETSVVPVSQPVLETILEVPPQPEPLALIPEVTRQPSPLESIQQLLRAFDGEDVQTDSLLDLLNEEISVLDASTRRVPSKKLLDACIAVFRQMVTKKVKFEFIQEQEKGLVELWSLVLRYCRATGRRISNPGLTCIELWIKHAHSVASALGKQNLIGKIFLSCDTSLEQHSQLEVLSKYSVSVEHPFYGNFVILILYTLVDWRLPKNWELQLKTSEIYQEAEGLNLPLGAFPGTFEDVPETLTGMLLTKMSRFGRPMLVGLASMGVFIHMKDITKNWEKFLKNKEFKEGKRARKLIVLFQQLRNEFPSIDNKELQEIYDRIVPVLIKQKPTAALKFLESVVLLAQIGQKEALLAYKEGEDLELKFNEFFNSAFETFKPEEMLKRYPALKGPLFTYYTIFQRYRKQNVEFAESAAYRAFLGEWHTFLDILTKKPGAFSDWRYDLKDAHMEKLHRYFTSEEEGDKWNIWKRSQIVQKPGGKLQGVFAGEEDQEIVPFFFVGRDIGSCQDYTASFDNSRGLLGYMHGKCVIVGVWNEIEKHWMARRILRVLFSEKTQKPVLVLEQLYGEPKLDKEVIQSALDRAKALELPLYVANSSTTDTLLQDVLESHGGRQFEYVDSGHNGLESSGGRYRLGEKDGFKFSQILSVETASL